MVSNKKRIQAYVSSSTYESLKSLAEDREMSLSEYIGELLQTQSVTSGSGQIIINGSGNDYVTREELSLMFEQFSSEIDHKIIREIHRAEIAWEESATALANINSKMTQMVIKHGISEQEKNRKQLGEE